MLNKKTNYFLVSIIIIILDLTINIRSTAMKKGIFRSVQILEH